ncbi:MAG: hypothetical protein ACD_51C00188G0003 [uncultured bacterium]|nr:MAG: hypothetical protein ACD_51C00188G0003 [uncultured bacterium]OGJ48133.1 MAG: hypothetical protein A2244_01440 [Candidatus Peregrinibacteria bacterium RIFOXYA2_FULL_41_18]OGJ49036.1 MAG: hypothetical protein A2344_00685 [Candidatus Peregrinibacteria bacterium RIFOXYB12_FULL_41_12]
MTEKPESQNKEPADAKKEEPALPEQSAPADKTAEATTVNDQAETEALACTRKEMAELLASKDQEQDRENVKNYINTLEGVEKVEDLRTLSLEQLFKLEEKYEGVLFYAFTDFMDGGAKLDFPRWQESYKSPREGDKFQINFLGNQAAYNELGAGDILPPSIRQITVWEKGDSNRARTSDRRIGLKGKNDGSVNGFFDTKGYISIFTGDVMIIGAPQKEFDEKYRTADGKLDYTKYNADESGKDTEFIKTKLEKGAITKKQPSSEEIDDLMKGIEAEGKGQKVVDAVTAALKEGMRGDHCWDWVNKVYKKAGAQNQRIYQDLSYPGKDCGDRHASESLMSKLRPGDWLYINNKNKYDENGCHSGIFLGWINEDRQIARMASCPGAGKKGHVTRENLKQKPVTYISKPF